MKIKEKNAGILTNFEVLDLLRSRGASKDPMRDVRGTVSPSELKVFDYLVESAACDQTKEKINEFIDKCGKFNLAKAEIYNIINLRPSLTAEIYSIIEEIDNRLNETIDELIEIVVDVLPPPPTDVNKVEEKVPKPEKMEGVEVEEGKPPPPPPPTDVNKVEEKVSKAEQMEGVEVEEGKETNLIGDQTDAI